MNGKDIIESLESGDIGPNEPVVAFGKLQCRSCLSQSDWFRTDDNTPHSPWDAKHTEHTGHSRYYLWTVTRQTAQVFNLGKPSRR
ncbi:hypothetical protein [Streptantibioticus ferralitis]|uniref:Uncharacterized protein n=1 Tax=Streptantibioticus ferralitis TaxID=236510 RepID=A0ABT5Z287_9ACTN|nr:hypothetical protein [Streptantibioticus ferralitis]MDF2257686.1 hypothetical protein [Streptantibioticus ferralitis]